jgi:hypothetical protein
MRYASDGCGGQRELPRLGLGDQAVQAGGGQQPGQRAGSRAGGGGQFLRRPHRAAQMIGHAQQGHDPGHLRGDVPVEQPRQLAARFVVGHHGVMRCFLGHEAPLPGEPVHPDMDFQLFKSAAEYALAPPGWHYGR